MDSSLTPGGQLVQTDGTYLLRQSADELVKWTPIWKRFVYNQKWLVNDTKNWRVDRAATVAVPRVGRSLNSLF
ncbi:unnamed protein product [Taenia asiatica]|uniref:Uncharacterized protein n=1 Tax=Taenia asiatica TaxID=60517 RepID=A0A0R3VYW4_TAEAS|nr:unnamed protein product [Taenia asiatica]